MSTISTPNLSLLSQALGLSQGLSPSPTTTTAPTTEPKITTTPTITEPPIPITTTEPEITTTPTTTEPHQQQTHQQQPLPPAPTTIVPPPPTTESLSEQMNIAKTDMKLAVKELRFEDAAKHRDKITELERKLKDAADKINETDYSNIKKYILKELPNQKELVRVLTRKGDRHITTTEIIEELKAFLILKFLHSDLYDEKLSPPVLVDIAWRQLILNTVLYQSLNRQILGSDIDMIHHSLSSNDDEDQRKDRYSKTIALYREHFQKDQPDNIWDNPNRKRKKK